VNGQSRAGLPACDERIGDPDGVEDLERPGLDRERA
jgi:hypothetical protein